MQLTIEIVYYDIDIYIEKALFGSVCYSASFYLFSTINRVGSLKSQLRQCSGSPKAERVKNWPSRQYELHLKEGLRA